MIQINCNNCKALLQIDDAFAGGVCRCRYCGTIQTVPKHLKQQASGEQAPVTTSTSKSAASSSRSKARTLYRKKTGPRGEPLPGSGSGLDELADIVASSGSGLSSGRLAHAAEQPDPAQQDAPRRPDRKTILIVSAAGVVIVVLLGIIIAMAVRDKGRGNVADSGKQPSVINTGQPTANPGVTFLGQGLESHKSVVFVLDRGQGTLEDGRLELLKTAVIRTLETFGEGRQFQVIFWERDGEVWAYPKVGLAPADKTHLGRLWDQMQNLFGAGQTKVEKAMRLAVQSNPDAICLVPVKPFLEEDFDQVVKRARGSSKGRVYCFSLAQENLDKELKQIAAQTNGGYRNVLPHELRAAAAPR